MKAKTFALAIRPDKRYDKDKDGLHRKIERGLDMHPIKMTPAFRFGAMTPWGGSALKDVFGKDIPDERTGESLEISVLPGLESRTPDGRTLSQVLLEGGEDARGSEVGEEFPLLLKLISARERLSVQVHPDDAYARANEGGKLGKTEAWVILDCKAGAQIVYGIREGVTKEQLASACAQGGKAVEDCLRYLPVQPGDVVYIPAGMVHAIGEDILILEIQQSSDVTYRFWDWGRLDKDGKARELHVQKGLDVTDVSLHLQPCQGERLRAMGGARTRYIEDPNFVLERLSVKSSMPLEVMPKRFRLLTALCDGYLVEEGCAVKFKAGDSLFIPASAGRIKLECTGDLLLCYPGAGAAVKR